MIKLQKPARLSLNETCYSSAWMTAEGKKKKQSSWIIEGISPLNPHRFPPCTLKTSLITTASFLCARKFEQFPLLYPLPKTTQTEIGKGIQYSLQLSIPLFPTKDLYKNDREASHHRTAGFKHNRLFASAIFWEFLTGGTLLFPYLPLFQGHL